MTKVQCQDILDIQNPHRHVKYIILTLPLPANGRKTSMAENIQAKDIYTRGSGSDIPPNKITINNREKCGGENRSSDRSMLENV